MNDRNRLETDVPCQNAQRNGQITLKGATTMRYERGSPVYALKKPCQVARIIDPSTPDDTTHRSPGLLS